jgi:hypothetical protein
LQRMLSRLLIHFFLVSRKIGQLWCDDWFHYHDTCSMEVSMCMGLIGALCHDLWLRLSDFIGGEGAVSDQSFSIFFPMKALQSSSPSYLAVHSHQNRCCVWASGSCVGCRCNRVLWFHLILQPSTVARACENAEP